jgi:hypothetical protein
VSSDNKPRKTPSTVNRQAVKRLALRLAKERFQSDTAVTTISRSVYVACEIAVEQRLRTILERHRRSRKTLNGFE